MKFTTLTSREFNRNPSAAKRASNMGPVFITNRNDPQHVLLSIEDYYKLRGERYSLVDALSMPGLSDIEFEPPRTRIESNQTNFC